MHLQWNSTFFFFVDTHRFYTFTIPKCQRVRSLGAAVLFCTHQHIHIHADKVPSLCLKRAGPSPLQGPAPGPWLCEQSWWAALSHQVSHTQEFVFLHESRSGLFSLYLACKLPWSCSAVEMSSAIDHVRCEFPSSSIVIAEGVFESKCLTTGV